MAAAPAVRAAVKILPLFSLQLTKIGLHSTTNDPRPQNVPQTGK